MDVRAIVTALLLRSSPEASTVALPGWDAPPSCPSRTQLVAAVEGALGRPLTTEDAATLSAHGVARRRADGRWQLTLTIAPRDGVAGTRTILADRCALLVDAFALLVAVAIDPARDPAASTAPRGDKDMTDQTDDERDPVERPSPGAARAVDDGGAREVDAAPAGIAAPAHEPTGGEREVDGAPAGIAAPARDERAMSRRRAPISGALGGGLSLDVGALPGPTPGLSLRAALLTRRARVELGYARWLGRTALAPTLTPIGGRLHIDAGQLQACPRLPLPPVVALLCAGVELGAMTGAGFGGAPARSDAVLWLALLADARLSWAPRERFALIAEVGLAAPLVPARFRLGGLAGDLHRAAPVAFRGGLAVEVRFP
ncbi:MAG: hypothetical protein KC636_17000 [Myxococcales bacterium]|nr:hypothetical protein [Myxococcales bacterium]